MTVDQYLRQLRRELRVRNAASREVLREVSAHLHESVRQELAGGADSESAQRIATQRFGPVVTVADRLSVYGEMRTSVPPRRPRAPGKLYAVLVVVLLVVLGTLALTTRQQPPPTIAEFAPQAVDNITDAPSDQGSRSGSGKGATSGAQAGAGAATPPATQTTVPRVRRCVGDPPRQIEDPQSPPCVPYWQGDNGGSTYRGVTADEIIVVAQPADSDAQQGARVNADLAKFFNSRFEFYGRTVTLVAPKDPGVYGGNCSQRKAGAVSVVEESKAFAILMWGGNQMACFFEEAARSHLMNMEMGAALAEKDLRSGRPYLWQYGGAADERLSQWGRWACQRLAGKPAEYSPDPLYRQRTRRFGLLVHTQQNPFGTDISPVQRELERCGEVLAVTDVIENYDGKALNDFQAETTNSVVRMKDRGVTTALVSTGFISGPMVPSAATANGYFPEWVLNDGLGPNYSVKTNWPDAAQRQSLMAVLANPAQVPYDLAAINWALAEVDPGFGIKQSIALTQNELVYWTFLMLASGIQMAGPNLNPQTFEQGLHRTVFPNPASPPVQEGWVGFPGGTHGMIRDAAAVWWNDAAPSPYADEGAGAWCYAEGGRRYKTTEWTKGPDGLFGEVCDSYPAGLR